MSMLPEISLFEVIPKEHRMPNQARWWNNVRQGKYVSYPVGRGIRRASDLMLLSVVIVIGFTIHAPGETIVLMELLFGAMCALLLVTRIIPYIVPVVGSYLVVVALAVVLNLAFPSMWGNAGIYTLCVTMFYRCPLRWSLPLGGVCILALAMTDGALHFLPISLLPVGNPGTALFNLFLAVMLCWFGWTLRTQYLLVVKLHEVQDQLREQVVRNEELATERERTRIARDIHDVLSHSLAVLSIQVQAARHLIVRDPERVAAKLDDMAALIRESITESRRVVGLLRGKAPTLSGTEELGASLHAMATTFNERTGINCRFEEGGTPHQISLQQRETLHQALREMLTNAHRHGAARTVKIMLQWREASLMLVTCDDGMDANAIPQGVFVQEKSNEADGHHGLQGMRERVTALGGDVEAGPEETGGFRVVLRLPFEQLNK